MAEIRVETLPPVHIENSELEKEYFDVDFNGDYMLRIGKQDGKYKVLNAMNGWGNNCYSQFQLAKVEVLI